MAVVSGDKYVTMTAITDVLKLKHLQTVVGITFQGTGLTAAQRVTVRDVAVQGSGNILADFVTMAATDRWDAWNSRREQPISGLSIDNNTVAGTWVLTVFLRD